MPAEPDRAFEEIRREVIESRNLVIKTDNLLKNLHAELKLVAKRQDDAQRRQWVNSAAAYLLFVGLCGGAAWAVTQARASGVSDEKERLVKQLGEASTQVEKLKADAALTAQVSRSAHDAYRMMVNLPGERRVEGLDAVQKLDQGRLTSLEKLVIQEQADRLRREGRQAAYERGRVAFRKQEFGPAAEELGRFVTMGPPHDELIEASYFLGASLVQLKKGSEAIPHLQRFTSEDRKSKAWDHGMLLLAQAYDQAGQADRGIQTAKEALAVHPASELAAALRVRAGRPPEPPKAAPPAAPPAPAPTDPTRQPLKPGATAPAPPTPGAQPGR